MTSSNRVVNRLLLALAGLVVLAAAVWLGSRTEQLAGILGWSAPDVPAPDDRDWMIVAGASALVALLSVIWVATRGRGAVRDVHAVDGLSISHDVAAGILRQQLAGHPDLASLTTRAYRVRGRRALLIRVAAVRGARLPRLLDAARAAVAELDRQLEQSIPVVLHLTSDSRVIRTRDRRVD